MIGANDKKTYIKPEILYNVIRRYNTTGIKFESIKRVTGYTTDEIRPILAYGQNIGIFYLRSHKMWRASKRPSAELLERFFSYTVGKKIYTINKNKTEPKKWNDKTAIEFRKEMDRLKELKLSDPNSFDRTAMK